MELPPDEGVIVEGFRLLPQPIKPLLHDSSHGVWLIPTPEFHVRKGAGLPDLADPKEWAFDGTAARGESPPDLANKIEAKLNAFGRWERQSGSAVMRGKCMKLAVGGLSRIWKDCPNAGIPG